MEEEARTLSVIDIISMESFDLIACPFCHTNEPQVAILIESATTAGICVTCRACGAIGPRTPINVESDSPRSWQLLKAAADWGMETP